MKKRILTLSIIFSILSFIYMIVNINTYTLYYISKAATDDNYSVVAKIVLEHLYDVPEPDISYRFVTHGKPSINKLEDTSTSITISTEDDKYGQGFGLNIRDKYDNNYFLLLNGKLTVYYPSNEEQLTQNISTYEMKQLEKEVHKLLKRVLIPILEESPKPPINLQWCFNLFYYLGAAK
ncbi:hypothetical protein [Streptococcus himalayensis]|uniref:Uncharacterized protein n=1 Tax=Streptococcus himalayensis TaxID=1888195 RepID=A0A917A8V1_9STRE|nr:hypothetical protein [Streptococcus himalayensis]GGE34911.1 hypothetical protein GCM10011510_15340 [Streptococcus himalayensis]